jgi:methionine sulfoxide reductase catalytic subunit
MLIRTPSSGFNHSTPSDITPQGIYLQRRDIIRAMSAGVAGTALATWAARDALAQVKAPGKLAALAKNAGTLKPKPWTVEVEGLVNKPGKFAIEDLLKLSAMEERIYRLRCVEGWSMVVPWVGYSLSELIKRVEPQGSAKYVEFITLADRAQMPGLRSGVLDWPYTEGLRMDEAMHPLTLLAFGMYGEVLPNQNGAPLRLMVPWKYGFKSGKSIVKIRFTEKEPRTSWNVAAAQEYGFFSNVNPEVDHPRWSQATERRIGEDGVFQKKRKTLMFNGYEAQVGQLYAGMNLRKFF